MAIRKCLKDDVKAELFCKKFLINQITEPTLTLDDLNNVTDKEICIILQEYLKIENFDEYFDFNSSTDIYTIFKEGMLSYNEHTKELLKPLIDSLILPKSLLSYVFSISNIANEVSTIYAPLRGLYLANQINIPYFNDYISNSVNFSGILSLANNLETIQQIIKPWQNWIRINEAVIHSIKNITFNWYNFQERYKISAETAQKYLRKYHWFISPNMDYDIAYDIVKVCESSSNHKRKEINEIFTDYFLDNNCEKLDMLLNNWSDNPLFVGRLKIIKDCINVIKNNTNKNVNYANVIIPTLITQIDGIQNKFMEINGLTLNYGKICDLHTKKEIKINKKTMNMHSYFRQFTKDNEFLDAMNDVFLDLLFQNVNPGEKCSFIQFNRHKILHGENRDYGKKVYLLRYFMILDFLSELMFIDKDEQFN